MSSANKFIYIYGGTVTSHFVMVAHKLHLDVIIDQYIILCKFGSHTISGYRGTGVGPPNPTPPPPPPPHGPE